MNRMLLLLMILLLVFLTAVNINPADFHTLPYVGRVTIFCCIVILLGWSGYLAYAKLLRPARVPPVFAQLEIGDAAFGSFRLLIQNGPEAISSIRIAWETIGASGNDVQLPYPIELAANARMSAILPLIGRPQGLKVEIRYDKADGDKLSYVSIHRFQWSDSTPAGKIIDPHSSSHQLADAVKETWREESAAHFRLEEGSFSFVARTSRQDGSFSLINVGNPNRRLLVDCAQLRARFETRLESGALESIELPFTVGKNGNIIVVVTWNKTGGALRVNDVDRSSPGFISAK